MFLSGLLGGGGAGARQDLPEDDGPAAVERIIDRLENAAMLSDRRDACRTLRALARNYRVEAGKGMSSLLQILDQDRADLEIVNLSLETLAEIICEQDHLGEQFTEIFIKEQSNVGIILDLIEEHDFSVRWSAIKLLSGLVLHQTKQMQTVILSLPMGISRLMDLLVDSREVIRNDALLMLTQLTKSNANIQKIVAFESAFDRLLDIISSEGFADGGIVVEDSLNIMLNLLHNNISNLNYFKEGPYIVRLVDFFNDLNNIVTEWAPGKVANVLAMYKVIRCLVSPNNPNNVTQSCQTKLRKSGLLSVLCDMLMASGVPAHVLWENINTVAEVIRGCPDNQAVFKSVDAPSNPPTSAVLILLMSMLNEKQPLDLRCAILYCFQCYVDKNPQVQAEFVDGFENCIEAKHLHQGLTSKDPMSNWLASMAISYLIRERKLLDNVVNEVAVLLKNPNMPNQSRVGYLIVIATWLCGSEVNVAKFVNSSDNISYLTAELCLPTNEQQEAIVQSLCAITLALCIVFNDDSNDAFNKQALRTLITNRVGKDSFMEKLTMLSKQPCYTAAVRSPQVISEQTLIDFQFCSLYRGVENMVQKCLVENDVQQQHIDELKKVIRQQELLINQLRNANSTSLPQSSASGSSLVPTFNIASNHSTTPAGPPVQKVAPVFEKNYYEEYQKAKLKIAELETELQNKQQRIEDLLYLTGEQSSQLKEYEDRLQSLGQTIEVVYEHSGDVIPLTAEVQTMTLEDQVGVPVAHHVVVGPSGAQGDQHRQGMTTSVTYTPQLLQSYASHTMVSQEFSQPEPVRSEAHQVDYQSHVTQMAQDGQAIQAVSSVVPAPIVQTASVSDLNSGQPSVMTVAEAPLLQSSSPQVVQFYNPAALFQPVPVTETPVLPLSEQPPRPPSSTVSSSAAELAGNGTRSDPEANDGFEMVPTPTAQQAINETHASSQAVQHHQQNQTAQNIPIVYPFQQNDAIPTTYVPTGQASVQMSDVHQQHQQQQLLELTLQQHFQQQYHQQQQQLLQLQQQQSQLQQIHLLQQHQQPQQNLQGPMPPARQLFENAQSAAAYFPKNDGSSML